VGVLLADEIDGPFCLDLLRLRALHTDRECAVMDTAGPAGS